MVAMARTGKLIYFYESYNIHQFHFIIFMVTKYHSPPPRSLPFTYLLPPFPTLSSPFRISLPFPHLPSPTYLPPATFHQLPSPTYSPPTYHPPTYPLTLTISLLTTFTQCILYLPLPLRTVDTSPASGTLFHHSFLCSSALLPPIKQVMLDYI